MALEKHIRGKIDDAHHDGRYSNVKREMNALAEEVFGEQYMASRLVWANRDKLPQDLVQWHADFLRFHGLIDEADPFFGDTTLNQDQDFMGQTEQNGLDK